LTVVTITSAAGLPSAEVSGALPTGRPDSFEVGIELGGAQRTLRLQRHSLRAPGFQLRNWSLDGTRAVADLAPPATYRGSVNDDPTLRVVAHIDAGRLVAIVARDGKPLWGVGPQAAVETASNCRAIPAGLNASEWTERSGTGGENASLDDHVPNSPAEANAHDAQHLAQIAFDIDFHYYLLKGSSEQNSLDAVEAIMNTVDFFYARDLLVTYTITDVLIRTSQFYFPSGGGDLLDQFRLEWNANQGAIVRDMAHMMTNKSGIEFGGLAYVGAVCNAFAYGWSLDSANIVGHELGHNWGSGHCNDLSPCNNMCGGCFYIAPKTKVIKSDYRDGLSCLDDVGAYPTPLPPYAHPERLTVTRDTLATLGSHTFDILGNDHDGNLDPLQLDAFDGASERTATVTLSSGSGPEGRDELTYTAPGFVFPGEDLFHYTVGDGTGLSQAGQVVVATQVSGLAGYWSLDERSGVTVADASNLGRNGLTEGLPLWGAGQVDGALRVDGSDDAALLPPLRLETNELTIGAWVNRLGPQNPWAGIVFSRDENTIAGLSVGNAHELRYHWEGTHWSWDSGLVLPASQWCYVALVIEPTRATLYLWDGVSLQSAVNVAAHGAEEFDGVTKLGHDSSDETRRLRGFIDDVRIYDRAFDASEIQQLVDGASHAISPNPPDAGRFVPTVGELSWLPVADALSYDLYFGEDYVDVRDAGIGSNEFLANQTQTHRSVGGIVPGQIYAWRLDTHTPGGLVPGDVWLFEQVEPAGSWLLNETAGTVAGDSHGTLDGIFKNGVTLGETGATATSGHSIYLDGIDDYVEIPPLETHSFELSVTGWVRRDGVQNNFAGMVFSRAGDTVAGISTQVTGGLRYHWNDAYWDWNSTLTLPDNQWTFFALVLRQESATIYLGVNGVVTAAVNSTLHGAEEFDGALDLGRDGTVGRYFRGWLDEIRIYRQALSPRDIQALHDYALQTASGEVPDGATSPGLPLTLGRADAGALQLSWSASCSAADTDYAIYEGPLGSFDDHGELLCSTESETTAVIAPSAGSRYYLVVPRTAISEGAYGRDSEGIARGVGLSSCLPQQLGACD